MVFFFILYFLTHLGVACCGPSGTTNDVIVLPNSIGVILGDTCGPNEEDRAVACEAFTTTESRKRRHLITLQMFNISPL